LPARETPAGLIRLISIADEPGDDDARRRKRVGVVAGYLTIVAPLTLPLQARGEPLSYPVAIGLSAFSVAIVAIMTVADPWVRDAIGPPPYAPPVVLGKLAHTASQERFTFRSHEYGRLFRMTGHGGS
jgi:hypothetical protein